MMWEINPTKEKKKHSNLFEWRTILEFNDFSLFVCVCALKLNKNFAATGTVIATTAAVLEF